MKNKHFESVFFILLQSLEFLVGFRHKKTKHFYSLRKWKKRLILFLLIVTGLNQNKLQKLLKYQKVLFDEKLIFDKKHQKLNQFRQILNRMQVLQHVYKQNIHKRMKRSSHLTRKQVNCVHIFFFQDEINR